MGRSTKRARDADRDLAVEFIQDAWVDGQLTREEHDERVDRVLRARTIADVEREVTDLQGPGGAVWRPTVPPIVPTVEDTAPVPRPFMAPATADDVDSTKALIRLGSIGLVGIIGFVALGNVGVGSEQQDTAEEWAEPASFVVDLGELTAAVDLGFGTTRVHSVRLRDNGRARVVVPSDESSTGAFEVVYDADLGSWLKRKEVTATGELVNLERLRSAEADQLVDSDEHLRSAWVEPGTVDGTQTCLRTLVVEDDGDEVTRHHDCDGERID